MRFFWDDPINSALVLLLAMLPALLAMAPGLVLSALARSRASRVDPSADESAIDGAGLASAILGTIGASATSIVRASGPLANFYDPGNREVRLSEAVAAGRTPGALGTAAHEAGHALQDARGYPGSRLRPPLVLGARLASGVALMTLLAGVLMLSPGLCYRGAVLYSAAAVALLVALLIERDANRRALAAMPPGVDNEAFRHALEAAAWADLASTWPGPRSVLGRRRARPRSSTALLARFRQGNR